MLSAVCGLAADLVPLPTRRTGTALLAGLLLASCQKAEHTGSGPPSSAPPSPIVNVRLDPHAGSIPGRTLWQIPIGPRTDELGLIPARHELNPLLPSSFLIDEAGIWVLDPVKHRIARYALTGKYQGAVYGISELADDMAPLPDGRLLISDDASDHTRLRVLTPGPTAGTGRLSAPIDVSGVDSAGNIRTLGGFVLADETTGVSTSSGIRPLTAAMTIDDSVQGLPLPDGGKLSFTYTELDKVWHYQLGRPYTTSLTFTLEGPAGAIGVDNLQVRGGALYARVSVAQDAAKGPSLHYVIELGPDFVSKLGRFVDSDSRLQDANIRRHFEVTADGRLIQMLVDPHRVTFRQLSLS